MEFSLYGDQIWPFKALSLTLVILRNVVILFVFLKLNFKCCPCDRKKEKNGVTRIQFFSTDFRTWHVFLPFYLVYIEIYKDYERNQFAFFS